MKIFASIFIFCILLMQTIDLYAHGDTHERIAVINKLLLEDPDNAQLYYKRACLYLDHNELTNALVDLDKSTELNSELHIAYFKKAELFYKLELFDEALNNVNQYLDTEKEKTEFALLTKARIYSKLSEFDKSIQIYKQVLKTDIPELPEVYFELVDVYLQLEKDAYSNAIECLEEGISKLGDLQSFHLKIISIHCQFDQIEKAVSYVDELVDRMPRKEAWYKLKGDILKDAGRAEEAMLEYNQALESINLLSEHRKNTGNMTKLKQEINIAIQNLTQN